MIPLFYRPRNLCGDFWFYLLNDFVFCWNISFSHLKNRFTDITFFICLWFHREKAKFVWGAIRKLFLTCLYFSYHLNISIDTAVSAVLSIFCLATGRTPQFRSKGGGPRENLALQNIQVRKAYQKCIKLIIGYLPRENQCENWIKT